MNLFDLTAAKYPATDKRNVSFVHAYENAFLNHRENIKLLFEIGVNNGGGVRTFRDYFPNALIVGIEIDPRFAFQEDRIVVEIGNATDKDFMNSLIAKYGNPDIVVDDGSHISYDIINSFNLLYNQTNFCYVIEDMDTQYQQHTGGYYIPDGIPATKILHEKIEELMQNAKSTSSMRVHPHIAFLFK
jgi:hypothetical protein